MKVPLIDLAALHAPLKEDLVAAFERVLANNSFILGDEVRALEAEIAALSGTRFALGVSSGTDALLVALMALGVGPGDEVITTDYSFFATAGAIARLGATPVFVDIESDTFNIDPRAVSAALTTRTRAVIPVHLFGQAADMDALLEVVGDIPIIEDGAQAIGAELPGGRRVNSVGRIGCVSFFPSKNLGALGDAGAVVTNDSALHEAMAALRGHGARVKYHHDVVGGNFRIDALQAALLRVKLPHLDRWTALRRQNAAHYRAAFARRTTDPRLVLPREAWDKLPRGHVYNQFVIRAPQRDAMRAFLLAQGVQTEVYYPLPFHKQPCFSALSPAPQPNAARAAEESLALPISPDLSAAQLDYVVDSVCTFLDRTRG